jgi:phage regulator Rha-like protein
VVDYLSKINSRLGGYFSFVIDTKKKSTCIMVDYKTVLTDREIISKIFIIRDQKIMLDRDLAEIYGVETKVLKQAVKRNIERFPEDFMFVMTKSELEDWRSQFVTSNSDRMGLRHLPYCFTEQGVTMLSCILNSQRAIELNIKIIRVFTKMREAITGSLALKIELEELKKQIEGHGESIANILRYLDELIEKESKPKPIKKIGFKLPHTP